MTYQVLCDKIAQVAMRQEFVGQVKFGSVYDVNSEDDTYYPLLAFELLSSKINSNNITEYKFRVVYLDMLTNDSSNINEVNQQTIYTFNSLMRAFDNDDEIDFEYFGDVTYVQQELRDMCAGGYITVNIMDYTPYDYCTEFYEKPTECKECVCEIEDFWSEYQPGYVDFYKYKIDESKQIWKDAGLLPTDTSYSKLSYEQAQNISYLPNLETIPKYFIFKNYPNLIIPPMVDTSSDSIITLSDMYSMETIPLYDTSKVTNMSSMFNGCASLKYIPLIDTSSVTNMYRMFSNCSALNTIPLLDTSKVTSMEWMFYNCYNLKTIPQIDTSKATNMSNMFYYCSNLKTIPQIDTSKATNMSNMFYYCKSLVSVPNFDYSNATTTEGMFRDCPMLRGDLIINCTDKLTMARYMFWGCQNINSIEFGDTSNVSDWQIFFQSTKISQIYNLDFSKWKNSSSYPFTNSSTYQPSNLWQITFVDDTIKDNIYFQYCKELHRGSLYRIVRGLSPDVVGKTVTFAKKYNPYDSANNPDEVMEEIDIEIARGKGWNVAFI